MKPFVSLIMASIFSLTVGSSAHAGGSLATNDVLELLKQNQALYKLVTETIELDDTAWATRIGTAVSKELGGARIAPYFIRAKRKGTSGEWQFMIEVEAKTKFFDANGKEADYTVGVRIEEKLEGIRLVPIDNKEQK